MTSELDDCNEKGDCNDWDDFKAETCYECTGYGNDYYMDEDGEFVCACQECWVNPVGG